MFLWDYILTFEMEVNFVWKSKWNFMKGLYIFQRYLPFTEFILFVLSCQYGVVSIFSCSIVFYRAHGRHSEGKWLSEGTLHLRRFVKLTRSTLKWSRWNLFCAQYLRLLGFMHLRESSAYNSCFESYSLVSNSNPHATNMGRVESEPAIDHHFSNLIYPFLHFRSHPAGPIY